MAALSVGGGAPKRRVLRLAASRPIRADELAQTVGMIDGFDANATSPTRVVAHAAAVRWTLEVEHDADAGPRAAIARRIVVACEPADAPGFDVIVRAIAAAHGPATCEDDRVAGATLEEWRAAGTSFLHRGHKIFVRDEGEGDALLLVHGFPTASWDWHALFPDLVRRFRVVAPDMIGFGFSAKPRDYAYSIHDQADLCETLLASLGVRRVHVLAHDYGDTVAQELVARHDERLARGEDGLAIRSVCLLNGGLFPETHRPRAIQRLLLSPLGPLVARFTSRRTFERSFAPIFGPRTRPSARELDDFWRLVESNDGTRVFPSLIHYMTERRVHRARWVGALQRTSIPLRVVDGPLDPISGAHMVERYRELVPNPDTVLLEGIGHYPQVEDPEGTLAAFLAFVDALE